MTGAAPTEVVPLAFSLRARRCLLALLRGPTTREDLDRITRASNSPEVVRQLRHAAGITILCGLQPTTDADGLPTRRGVYRLPAESVKPARSWLTRQAALLRRVREAPSIETLKSMVQGAARDWPMAAEWCKTLLQAFRVARLEALPLLRRAEFVGCFLARCLPDDARRAMSAERRAAGVARGC